MLYTSLKLGEGDGARKLALANIVEAYLNSGSKVTFSEYYSTKGQDEIQKIINSNPAHS